MGDNSGAIWFIALGHVLRGLAEGKKFFWGGVQLFFGGGVRQIVGASQQHMVRRRCIVGAQRIVGPY